MKQLRFILAALLLMVCGTIAHAQKVVVYKSDGTKVEYNASDVKEVKYEKAEEVLGYYSFKETAEYKDMAKLTEEDYKDNKLTEAITEVPNSTDHWIAVATLNNVAPIVNRYSKFA